MQIATNNPRGPTCASFAKTAVLSRSVASVIESLESRRLLAAPVIGNVWQRSADWTVRPSTDIGTTNGNPDADANGNPVWQYESVPLGRGMGEPTTGSAAPNPWYAGVATKLTWDNSWYGQPGGWTGGNDVAPLIHPTIAVQSVNNTRVPVVRWVNPTGSGVTVALSGVLDLSWSKFNGPEMMFPIDFVMMLQKPDGSVAPLVTANRKPPAFTLQQYEVDDHYDHDDPSIWIDLPAVKVPAGGSIFYTFRYEDAVSRSGWVTLDDSDLKITLKSLSAVPLVANDTAVTNVGRKINTEVLANDKWDPRTLPRVSILSAPSHGVAIVRTDQSIDYTPTPGYVGSDVLTYQVNDGSATNTATLNLTVNQPYYLYVKPTGNNANSGASWATALASLDGARQKIRALRGQNPSPLANKAVEVIFEDGVYPTHQSVLFDALDSGTAQYPVTYRSVTPSSATISAAKTLNLSWQTYAPLPGSYVADLSTIGLTATELANINTLLVNNRLATRAREPDVGYYKIVSANPATKSNTFVFGDTDANGQQDILSTWTNLTDVEIVSYAMWSESRMPIGSVNTGAHTVTTQGIIDYLRDYGAIHAGNGALTGATDGTIRYYVENVLQGLDTPGEWYLDATAKKLYYHPRAGESISTSTFAAPSLKRADGSPIQMLLSLSGTSHVRFDGLTFADTDWQMASTGHPGGQAAGVNTYDAVYLDAGSHDILFSNGRFTRTGGGYGIRIKSDATSVSVIDTEFVNNAGGGVAIAYVGPTTYSGNHRIALNSIHDNNLVWREAAGIFAGPNGYNRIAGNNIYNLTANGIGMGWFNSNPLAAGHNQIVWNTVSTYNTVLYDGGGIYVLGAQPFSVIMGNTVSDGLWTSNHLHRGATTYPDGSYTYRAPAPIGIYADETASGQRIMGNMIRDNVWGIFLHRNRDNIVTDNILADCRQVAVYLAHVPGTLHSAPPWFESNVIAWTQSLPTSVRLYDAYYWSNPPWMAMNHDVISYGPVTVETPNTYGLPYLQSTGRDQQALVTTDPLFVNAAANDYRIRLSAQSLVKQQGFDADWLLEPPAAPSSANLTINNGSTQRSKINSLSLTFDRPVSLTSGAITLVRRGLPVVFTLNGASSGGFASTYTLTFSGTDIVSGSLPDGVYDLTINADSVVDAFGQTLTGGDRVYTFHRLFGDSNGDKTVTNFDYSQFKKTYGLTAGSAAYNAAFDYDGTESITNFDYSQFKKRYGSRLIY